MQERPGAAIGPEGPGQRAHGDRLTEKALYATIRELAAGKKKGVVASNERVICIPIGTGAMDVSVATLAWERAKEKGIGGTYSFVEY